MNCLIIAGGSLEDTFGVSIYEDDKPDFLLAADKGMEFCYRNKIKPDVILGDFDSANPEILDYFRQEQVEIQSYPKEKDWTDTELAVRFAIGKGAKSIRILGATGGRMDHFLGNLEVLKLGLDQKVSIFLLDPQNFICMFQGYLKLYKREQIGKYVSFIPYTDVVEDVTLTGFRYNLNHATVKKGSTLCISNEIQEPVAEVHTGAGIMIMIEAVDS